MESFLDHLETGARAMGAPLERGQLVQMDMHCKELLAWNKKVNLTSIKDSVDFAEKQFLDVLPLSEEIPPGVRVLDVGSGGGFPGLPLKIVRPDLELLLIDGRRKKVSFLKHVIRLAALEGIQARHIRAEELARQMEEGQGRYDVVVSKAVGDLRMLVSIGMPMLSSRGMVVAMKGNNIDKEVASVLENDASQEIFVKKKTYTLPFSKIERNLVVFKRRANDQS